TPKRPGICKASERESGSYSAFLPSSAGFASFFFAFLPFFGASSFLASPAAGSSAKAGAAAERANTAARPGGNFFIGGLLVEGSEHVCPSRRRGLQSMCPNRSLENRRVRQPHEPAVWRFCRLGPVRMTILPHGSPQLA